MKKIDLDRTDNNDKPYSQVTIFKEFYYLSGQIPFDSSTGTITGKTIIEQTNQVISNISAILKELNLTYKNVIKTTCYLVNMEDLDDFNSVYLQFFLDKPSRTCIGVQQLPKNSLIEIEVVAADL